jgi:hypothetical protein
MTETRRNSSLSTWKYWRNFVLFFVLMTYESWENVTIWSSKHCLKSCKRTSKRLESKKNLLTTSKSSIQTSSIIYAKQILNETREITSDRKNHAQNHDEIQYLTNHHHENGLLRQNPFNQLRTHWKKKNSQSDNDLYLFTFRTVKSHSLLNFKTFNLLTNKSSLKNLY